MKVAADILNEQDVQRLFDAAGDVEGSSCALLGFQMLTCAHSMESLVLLNNAGTLENVSELGRVVLGGLEADVVLSMQPAAIGESNVDEWFGTFEVNVKVLILSIASRPANLLTLSTQGTYLPTRELLKRIAATPRSSPVTIINTSSIGSTNTRPGMSSYQSSKSAINRFTEFLSYEYPETVRTFACVTLLRHPSMQRLKQAHTDTTLAEL